MKHFKILLLLLSLSTIFYSCNNDDTPEEASATFTAIINGETVVANTITGNNLMHIDNGTTQAATLVFYAENDQYKFTVTLADHNNTTNCLSIGDYQSNIPTREVILWISYKHNGNTYMIHTPDNIASFSTEYIKVTSCSGNKISGELHGSYTKEGEISGLETPDTIELGGTFENIPFTVLN